MKIKTLFIAPMIGAFLLLLVASGIAGIFDGSKSLNGVIQKIDSNVITVSHVEPSNKQVERYVDVQVNYDTKYNEVNSISQLQTGDQVKVQYKKENGVNIATEVARQPIPAQATY